MVRLKRRDLLVGASMFVLGGCGPRNAAPGAPTDKGPPPSRRTRVILLGTGGGPRIVANGRAKPATLILVDGDAYVVDCGSGVARQLVHTGTPLTKLRYVFITHHHSDHNLDYGNLVNSAWVAGLKTQVDAYGPAPLRSMTEAYWVTNAFDVQTRIADEGRPDIRTLLVAHEFERGGMIMQNDRVRVSAARVVHPPIAESYAYRFDTPDRSVVVSGDTAYSEDLVALAKGADVLVHEAMNLAGVENLVKRVPNAATLRASLLSHHTSTEDVGRVAAAAQVKSLVLTHLVPADDSTVTEAMWLDGVRKHYSGRVVLGSDLLEV